MNKTDTVLGEQAKPAVKPRLALLTTKQQGAVYNSSEDHLDYNTGNTVGDIDDTSIGKVTTFTNNRNIIDPSNNNKDSDAFTQPGTTSNMTIEQELPPLAGCSDVDTNQMSDKLKAPGPELIQILTMIKGELENKEIALAAIKCEQLKRLLNPVEISRSALATKYMQLQDKLKLHDQNNNSGLTNTQQPSGLQVDETDSSSTNNSNTEKEKCDRESLDILNTLLEFLDRHPLLALPRDSIYCLDYSCNETSTKNYLNLKIQHLDRLINQHRHYRYFMNLRMRNLEARCDELTKELEFPERNIPHVMKAVEKAHQKELEALMHTMELERQDKKAIVTALLAYINDIEASSLITKKLSDRLSNEDNKLDLLSQELVTLKLEHKQLKARFGLEKEEFKEKCTRLVNENAQLKAKIALLENPEQPYKLPKLLKQPSLEDKEPVHPVGELSAYGRQLNSTVRPIKIEKPKPRKSILESPTRAPNGSPTRPPPHRITATTTASTSSASATTLSGGQTSSSETPITVSRNGSANSNAQSISSKNATNNSNHSSSLASSNRQPTPTASSNDKRVTPRSQPLVKSASMSSPMNSSSNQPLRTIRGSNNNTSLGSASIRNTSSHSNNGSNQNVASKPQVPAKPALLLDNKRNQAK